MDSIKEEWEEEMKKPYQPRAKVTVHQNYVTLRIDDVKFMLKNPRVQPYNEYKYESSKDIMYFYYDWAMYRKHDRGWRKVHVGGVYEFGIMNHLEKFLDELLELNCRKHGIRHYFNERQPDGTVVKSTSEFQAMYPMNISGMFMEDAFHFTKYYKTFTDCRGLMEFEFYDLTILFGGNECGRSAMGAHFDGLQREDVLVIKDFARAFMELTDRVTKEQVQRYLYDDSDDEYNYAKKVRLHLLEKYGITDWVPIFQRLHDEEYIFDEYMDYITGETPVEELRCHEWHGEKRTMAQMLQVMRDYEAYIHVLEDNHN
ncbi:MAG: hypothetical protein IJZ68_08270 [Bacteroidaceae bacterium]|nr:hypothetical protein [Bacteroidaceae bacterium]